MEMTELPAPVRESADDEVVILPAECTLEADDGLDVVVRHHDLLEVVVTEGDRLIEMGDPCLLLQDEDDLPEYGDDILIGIVLVCHFNHIFVFFC